MPALLRVGLSQPAAPLPREPCILHLNHTLLLALTVLILRNKTCISHHNQTNRVGPVRVPERGSRSGARTPHGSLHKERFGHHGCFFAVLIQLVGQSDACISHCSGEYRVGEGEPGPFSWPHHFPYEEKLPCAIPFPGSCGSAPPVSVVGKQKALVNSAFQAVSGVDRFYGRLLACNAKPPRGNHEDNSCDTETRFPATKGSKGDLCADHTSLLRFAPPARVFEPRLCLL